MTSPKPPAPGSDDHALQCLASQGYLPLSLADHPDLLSTYRSLFTHAASFFALPESDPSKIAFLAPSGPLASEEGYSKIPNEKSIATVKTAANCPPILQHATEDAWRVSGIFMQKVSRAIATTLQLDPEVFSTLVDPCICLPGTKEGKTPTLLRMFRYDRPPVGSDQMVNAERHKDLGLLSLVIGHSPGLHVLASSDAPVGAGVVEQWIPIEEPAFLPTGITEKSGGLTATLLVGQTLAFLTRGAYKAGVHGVVCNPPPPPPPTGDPPTAAPPITAPPIAAPPIAAYPIAAPLTAASNQNSKPIGGAADNETAGDGEGANGLNKDKFRYSIVFTLRPAVAPVYTSRYESDIVGKFDEEERAEGVSSAELFGKIKSMHYNVNVAPEIREKQKRTQMADAQANEQKPGGAKSSRQEKEGKKGQGWWTAGWTAKRFSRLRRSAKP